MRTSIMLLFLLLLVKPLHVQGRNGGIWNKIKARIKKPSEDETSDTPSIMGITSSPQKKLTQRKVI